MEHPVKLSWILLMLMTICVTEGTFVQKLYRKLEPGQNIAGTVIAEKEAVSPIDCSRMCRGDYRCAVYQYKGTEPEKCLLIQKNCSDADGQIFEDDGNGETYHKVVKPGWSGSDAVLYQSFDSPNGLVLRESSELGGPVPLVSGLINCSLTLNHTRNQWVDLGIHTEACMTRPETCGIAGGTISFWVNVIDCPGLTGIISSRSSGKTGVRIYCTKDEIGFRIYLPATEFRVDLNRPAGWTHIVLNYFGPTARIKVYFNGAEVASDKTTSGGSRSTGDGRVVVGRLSTDGDYRYTSLQMDELAFFNKALSTGEITAMYNAV